MAKKVSKKKDTSATIARRVLAIEAAAINALIPRIDGAFTKAVELILATPGKVVVSGMGKSGIIGAKIASTLASTGTPAFFLHPAEGIHGDVGMIMKSDVLLAISNSGETEELVKMLPVVARLGIKLIAMTGRTKSTLSRYADVTLNVGVSVEACPLGLAPTASTTATLALGDALAVALLERRGFNSDDFALLHPAGSLGRRLLKVSDVMHRGASIPRITAATRMKDAIIVMTEGRMGLTGVFKGKNLIGVITDGDLRRALEKAGNILDKKAGDIMTVNPKRVSVNALAEAALREMEGRSITSLFAEDESGFVTGVVHMHDLIKAGVI